MKYLLAILLGLLSLWPATATAQSSFKSDVQPLVDAACMECHDSATETRLNFEDLRYDLADPNTFRKWERIFDRVHAGEMPPKSEARPDAAALSNALGRLERSLKETSLAEQQQHGRVRSRRLTRLEYAYTIRDLLLIEDDLSKMLPAESDAAGFDTVGAAQSLSPLHIRSYLNAADQALNRAINLKARPKQRSKKVDYRNSPYVNRWYKIPLSQGGGIIKKLDDAVVLYVDLDYIMRSDASGLAIKSPGNYRIKIDAYPYRAQDPVTLKLILASEQRGGAELLGAFDLLPDQTRSVEVNAHLKPGGLSLSIGRRSRHARRCLFGWRCEVLQGCRNCDQVVCRGGSHH